MVLSVLLERPAEAGAVERSLGPQRPGQSSSSVGQLDALERGVQVRPAPRQPSSPVDDHLATNRYDPKEVGLRRALPAPRTGADRGGTLPDRRVYSYRVYPTSPPAAAAGGGVSPPTGSASDRMSIRQLVSRAASRAFWPSLPIASDSW